MLLPSAVLSRVIDAGLSGGADFCEVYLEETLRSCMELKSSQTSLFSEKDIGAGIRLIYGNEEFYGCSNSLEEDRLIKTVRALSMARRAAGGASKKALPFSAAGSDRPPQRMREDLAAEKLFLKRADKDLRGIQSSISQCHLIVKKALKHVEVANSEGLRSFDIRPYFIFYAVAVANRPGGMERGLASTGHSGAQAFLDERRCMAAARRAAREALQNARADDCPAGPFPVIINKGFGGVIFHEACGHGMETTALAQGLSVFSDKIGKRVGPQCLTAYDDGTISGEYGSIGKDDEGKSPEKTCLIEKGVFKNRMADRLGAQKLSCRPTGSGRRENYKFAPASRMRNTYIAPGDSSLEEMIKAAGNGLFAESMGGGSVAPGTGNYNFSVNSGRWIKNGRLDRPVKGASLVGNGLDTLSKITHVGKDLELAPGHCGSVSGWAPVTVGQPPVLVSELTVGGRGGKK